MDRPASTKSTFFKDFPDFPFDPFASTSLEFVRLASRRHWYPGAKSKLYEKNWKACFGKKVPVRTPDEILAMVDSDDEHPTPPSSEDTDDEVDDLASQLNVITITRDPSTTGGVLLSPPSTPAANTNAKAKPRVSLPLPKAKAAPVSPTSKKAVNAASTSQAATPAPPSSNTKAAKKAAKQTQSPAPARRNKQSIENLSKHKTSTVLAHFNKFYGHNESNLSSWQALCIDCGEDAREVPGSITQCKKVLKSMNINIHHLLHAKLNDEIPHRLPSRHALEKFIVRSHMNFPLGKAKESRFLSVFLVGA